MFYIPFWHILLRLLKTYQPDVLVRLRNDNLSNSIAFITSVVVQVELAVVVIVLLLLLVAVIVIIMAVQYCRAAQVSTGFLSASLLET